MHGIDHLETGKGPVSDIAWYRHLNGYHWFVLGVSALGWLFDCLDQQLFTLARVPAMKELLDQPGDSDDVRLWGAICTSVFLIGWATGGLIFGVMGDRVGRAKTMMITILMYSLCTGLSALSVSVWDFAAYRFLTGLGVGGEFAVGVALVAEVMPEAARARALSLLQALSTVGNVSAALIGMSMGHLEQTGVSAWRIMFVIGALPALLALVIRARLKEPEKWAAAKLAREEAAAKGLPAPESAQLGSYGALFRHPVWRRHAILGLLLASAGVIGLWGIGFFSADLARSVYRDDVAAEVYDELLAGGASSAAAGQKGLRDLLTAGPATDLAGVAASVAADPAALRALAATGLAPAVAADLKRLREIEVGRIPKDKHDLTKSQAALKKEIDPVIAGKLSTLAGQTLLFQQFGAFIGMYAFGWITQSIGRRPTFAIALAGSLVTTALVFWKLDHPADMYWMVPLMGVFQLSLFAGYAIYFPELFPTHLRSTGVSFCYNVGRFVAATGPLLLGVLTSKVFSGPDYPEPLPFRYAGVTMCAIFVLGLLVLPFTPETKGRPLPE